MTDDTLRAARLGIVAALSEGDSGLGYRLVLEMLDDGVPMPVIVDEVLAPIQRDSGARWEAGDASVPEEHATTAAIETLVALLAGAFDQPVESDRVVIACAEGDSHTLPGRMAGALLAYEGLNTIFLGTSVPAAELASYLELVDADAVVLSCTRVANLLGARDAVAAAHQAGVPVAVGGRAFQVDEQVWTKLGADAHVARLPELTEVLSSWAPDIVASEAGASPVPPEVAAVIDGRAAVTDAVLASVPVPDGVAPSGERLLASSVDELVGVAAVARFLELPAVVAPQAEWVVAQLAQRAEVSLDVGELLSTLRDALAPVAPSVADVVAEATPR